MKNKLKIALILCFLPLNLFCQKISLKDAIAISIQKSEKVFQYKEKLIQKEMEEKESWGNFLPTVDFKASYTHLNDNMNIDLNPIRDAIITLQSGNQSELANIGSILNGLGALTQTQKLLIKDQSAALLNSRLPLFEETFKKQDYKTATIQAIQPIFVGGKLIAAKKYANSEKEAAQIELKRIQNEIVSETINNYLRVLMLIEVVKTREDAVIGIRLHQNKAKKLFEEGIIANYHLLRANVALAEAEKNLTDDQSNLELSFTALKYSLGIDDIENIVLSDSISYHLSNETLTGAIANATRNQPLLQFIQMKKISAEQNYNAIKSNFLPTVAAFGKYELYPEYLSSLEPRWAVGLQLSINVFNGFKDHMKIQSAKHLENEIMYLESDTKKKVELWVNKSFKEIGKSKTKYEKLDATIALAKENVKQNEKRFETGMGISLEVIDAHLTYEKVQLDRFVALFEYYKAFTDLSLACGDPSAILTIWNN